MYVLFSFLFCHNRFLYIKKTSHEIRKICKFAAKNCRIVSKRIAYFTKEMRKILGDIAPIYLEEATIMIKQLIYDLY